MQLYYSNKVFSTQNYLKAFSFFFCDVQQYYNCHFTVEKIDGLLKDKRLLQYHRGKLQHNPQLDLVSGFSLLLCFAIKTLSISEKIPSLLLYSYQLLSWDTRTYAHLPGNLHPLSNMLC